MAVTDAWWRLVKFGFRLLYNEMAFTYDMVSKVVSLGQWQCWQRAALKHLPAQGRVLEIAHGTGDLQLDLHAAGYATFGYDLSAHMGRIAGAKLHRQGIQPQFARGYAQQLPYGAQSFHAIVCTFPTSFIIAPQTLHEMQRVLRVGGCAVIVLNGVLTGGGAVRTGLEWLYRITGQRDGETSSEQALAHFSGYGFEATMHDENCPNSVAQLIILRKE